MRMLAPTTGPVTSGYGVPHRDGGPIQYAVDWGFYTADPSSKNLRAVASGSIVYAGPASGWGMHSDFGTIVVLQWFEDGYTWQAIYCHCATVTASGQVTAGQVIAVMGATGYVFGVHLHFILRRNGSNVNPLNYLSAPASLGSTPISPEEDDVTYGIKVTIISKPDPLKGQVPLNAHFVGSGTDPLIWVANWGPEEVAGVKFVEWDTAGLAERIRTNGLRGTGPDLNKVMYEFGKFATEPAVGDVTVSSDPKVLTALKALNASIVALPGALIAEQKKAGN